MPNLLTFIMCENIAVYLLNIFILLLIVNNSLVVNGDIIDIGITEGENNKYVTCGSVFKLFNTGYKVRLHSHDVKYGTGSGQQSVTGTEVAEDVNSHWVIKAETKSFCNRGEPVKCGSSIRLQHLVTSKNLHSHHFQSPLSGNQEISAYGSDGEGDTGDHWTVLCDDDFWERDAEVKLRHVDTNVYLSVTSSTYGRPINGQHEIVGVDWPNGNHVHWKAMEGLFIHKSNFNAKRHERVHTEL